MRRWIIGASLVVLTAGSIACGGGQDTPVGTVGEKCSSNGQVEIKFNGKWECQWTTPKGKNQQELHWVKVSD